MSITLRLASAAIVPAWAVNPADGLLTATQSHDRPMAAGSWTRSSPSWQWVALATDFADGRLAQRGEESAFGAFADPIADGVFWSWYALRWEPNRWLRWAPITLFAASTAAIAAAYFARGRAIDYPRPMAVRYA